MNDHTQVYTAKYTYFKWRKASSSLLSVIYRKRRGVISTLLSNKSLRRPAGCTGLFLTDVWENLGKIEVYLCCTLNAHQHYWNMIILVAFYQQPPQPSLFFLRALHTFHFHYAHFAVINLCALVARLRKVSFCRQSRVPPSSRRHNSKASLIWNVFSGLHRTFRHRRTFAVCGYS